MKQVNDFNIKKDQNFTLWDHLRGPDTSQK